MNEDNKAILEREKINTLKQYGCSDIPFDENVKMYYPSLLNAMDAYAEYFHQAKLKQETHIETPWDWFGWLKARIPNLEPKHKFWVQQCVRDLANIRIKQLAPSDESIQNKIEELFESNHKEFKGSNEAFIHFKEELAEWMRDQFLSKK